MAYLSTITFLPFNPDLTWMVGLLILLLLLSGFISGSETSFFSLTPNQVNDLEKEESKKAKTVLKLLEKQDYLLAAILIANNLVNICAVLVANTIIDNSIDFGGSTNVEFLIKIIVVTFMLLFFGEILPKVFATYKSMSFAKAASIPLMGMTHFFRPLSYLLVHSSSHINELVSKYKGNISIDEISDAIEITKQDQTVEDKKILSGIVGFVNTEVVGIMRPRIDVVGIDISSDFNQVINAVVQSGFSRIPVYKENLDKIEGVLYIKDLLPHLDKGADFDWQRLCRKPYFIPEHRKINDLLEDFQHDKVHMGIVVDEYGSTLGLVSLEDILEEIVGEISDESDLVESSLYVKLDENTYLFKGKTHLNDFLKILELEDNHLDEVKGEAETIAGLMLEIKGEFLKKGDTVNYRNLVMSVEQIEQRRIDQVKIYIDKKTSAISAD